MQMEEIIVRPNTIQIIRETLDSMKHPVRLVVFTSSTETDRCPAAVELANEIKSASGRVALEAYDMIMDRDKSQVYGVQRVPSFVVQDRNGKYVLFSGRVDGVSLTIMLDVVAGMSAGRTWLPETMIAPLQLMNRDVAVQVYLDNDCSLCRTVAENAVGFALASSHLSLEIIIADDFPELAAQRSISMLPTVFFGPKLRFEGHLDESMFLEQIFLAEGQQGAAFEKHCVVCSRTSGDVICSDCRSRIQVEAIQHKRTEEKLKQPGTIVKPRKNV